MVVTMQAAEKVMSELDGLQYFDGIDGSAVRRDGECRANRCYESVAETVVAVKQS